MSQFPQVSFSHVILIHEAEKFIAKGLSLCRWIFSGLSKRTTSEGLRTAFAQFGEVADGVFLVMTLYATLCASD